VIPRAHNVLKCYSSKKSDQVRRKIPIEHQVVRNTCNLYQEQSSEEKKDINNDLMGDDGREQPIVSALPYASREHATHVSMLHALYWRYRSAFSGQVGVLNPPRRGIVLASREEYIDTALNVV
jgi:hypothetical protein